MTLQKDQDPGWWRRGITKRGQIIVAVVALVIIVGCFVVAALNGISIF